MADSQHAAYIVIEGPGHEGTRLALREGITSFGRLPANDVILLGDLVSRHHSRITFFEGRATLQDLGSHNGSWVNGERASSKVLGDDDVVRVGNFRITFHIGPIPTPLDETTAGEAGRSGAEADPVVEGAATDLLHEVEAARQGATSSTRATHFLYRATDALARAADVREYASSMLELCLEHAPAEAAAWVRLEGERLVVEVSLGPEGPVADPKLQLPAVEWSLEKDTPVRADDLRADARFGRPDAADGSVLVVPCGAEPLGALHLFRSTPSFELQELQKVAVVAHLMSSGLEEVEARQARQEHRLLERLQSPLAAQFFRQGVRPEPSRGPVSAVAVWIDVHGLAPSADRIPPTELFAALGQLHARVGEEVESRGGALELLNGHRLLAVFGLRHDADSPAAAALQASARARAAVLELAKDHPALEGRRLRMGIASGEVVLGATLGGRPCFSVMGPATAVAHRLVDAAGPGHILVDGPTLEAAGSAFRGKRIGTQPARGRLPSLVIYQLLDA